MNIQDKLQAAGIFADLSAKLTLRCTEATGEAAQTLLTQCIQQINPNLDDVFISPLSQKTDPLVNRATIEVGVSLENLSDVTSLYEMLNTLSAVMHSGDAGLGTTQMPKNDAVEAYHFWGVASEALLDATGDEELRRGGELLVGLVNNVFRAMGVKRD